MHHLCVAWYEPRWELGSLPVYAPNKATCRGRCRKKRAEGVLPKDLWGRGKGPSQLLLPLFFLTLPPQISPRKCEGQPVPCPYRAQLTPLPYRSFSRLAVKIRSNCTVDKNPKGFIYLCGRGTLDEGSQGLHKGIRDPRSFLPNALLSLVCDSSLWAMIADGVPTIASMFQEAEWRKAYSLSFEEPFLEMKHVTFPSISLATA